MGDIRITDVDQDQSDPDPIRSSYDVYIKPRISGDRQIYVLQFPNRDSKQHYSQENESQPLKLRTKPEAGMLEIDVPIDVWRNYDRGKGIKWGDAAKKSNMTKGGGSHGLPGGFGIGGAQPTGRGRGRGEGDDELNHESLLAEYATTVQRDRVLKKQTLGGQFVANYDTSPQYMIGVWRENQLHLTPADQIVQMRPQFHHIDALSEQEHQLRARDPGAAPTRALEARAIHMTVKSTVDGEEDTTDTMAERIMATQQEPWTHHSYIDEDSADAWETFHENLFVSNEVVENQELTEQTRNLSSAVEDTELLDTISVTTDAAKVSRRKTSKREKTKRKVKEKGKEKEADGDHTASAASSPSSGSDNEDGGPV